MGSNAQVVTMPGCWMNEELAICIEAIIGLEHAINAS